MKLQYLSKNLEYKMIIKIFVSGHVDDLYALALLFPEGGYPGLHVVTGLQGRKDGRMDKVTDATDRQTFVTGDACLPLVEAAHGAASWIAREILAPLNGYAALADSNFVPVTPVSAEIQYQGGGRSMVFGEGAPRYSGRLITVDRHPNLAAMRNSRVDLMTIKPLAASAALVIAGPPNWSEYYRILEDIAGDMGVSLDKLTDVNLAKREALNGFKAAANNRPLGRHGASKRNSSLDHSSLMNLIEAREFVRSVVTKWLDVQCGGAMPTDRVDGGPLRFGLDSQE
ncbi:hypothetical protein [Methylobacterium indicum]|uniref:hypothetical protein n=1 Tax=Methylobacterium indicum TaxID=1775910 RepID=UPI000F7B0E41|nr:hypothetical protein [Methylobacterium indicum]